MIGWAPSQSFERKHPPLTPVEFGRGEDVDGGNLSEKGRPPTRRGRVGGFHWCPGHRGCRVTALITAMRRNALGVLSSYARETKKGVSDGQLRAACRHCPRATQERRHPVAANVRVAVFGALSQLAHPPSRLYVVKVAIVVPNPRNGWKTRVFGALRGAGRFSTVLKALQAKSETRALEGA